VSGGRRTTGDEALRSDGALAELLDDLAPLARRFADEGHRLYLVGGVVRDVMVGRRRSTDDVDLTTDAPPEVIRRLVAPAARALWTQGERFGTIGARIGERAVEITTHRAESYDPGSRKPVAVAFGRDLTVDLSRRDFTINAMALTVPAGELVDPFDGAGDLAARQLRTPLDPEVSFSDDPLRMLRAARFIARFDLQPRPELVQAMAAMGDRLAIVSVERIHDELERLLVLPRPAAGLHLLVATGLLARIAPEVAAAATLDPRFGDRPRWSVGVDAAARAETLPARRALLLWPAAQDPDSGPVSELTRRLRYSAEAQRETAHLVGAFVGVLDGVHDAPATVRRLAVDLAGHLDGFWDALAALRALISVPALAADLDALRWAGEQLGSSGELDRLDPPLDGRAVMEHLGCGPGPVVGEALEVLQSRIVAGGPLDEAQARAELSRWWADRRA
jgi:poly(A) polymerase